jgi:hypothetical protein
MALMNPPSWAALTIDDAGDTAMGESGESERPPASESHDNSGYTCIELYPDGGYKSLVPEIDTEWVLQGQPVQLRAGCTVKFFPSGAVEQGVLASQTTLTIFTVPAAAAEGTRVDFHQTGEVRSVTLASQARWFRRDKSWKYRGAKYAPGTRLVFSEDGAVERAEQAR